MTAALWAYVAAGAVYAWWGHRRTSRQSQRYQAACRRNPAGAALAVIFIAAVWPILAGDDTFRWAQRCRLKLRRRRILRRIAMQSVCTARVPRPTV